MKTLTLKLGEKLYTSGKITAWHSREAFAINKELLAFMQQAKNLSEEMGEEEVAELMETMEQAKNRRANLICAIYENKFTADELEKALSDEEITEQVNGITQGIMGIVQKN